MLSAISWAQFLLGTAGLGIAYYAVVVLLYYRQELKGLVLRKPLPATELTSSLSQANEPLDRALMGEVHDVMQEVNGVFAEAQKNKYINNELLYALQRVLRKYPDIKDTHFGLSINHYISDTAASHCAISFTQDELDALWKN